MIQRVISAKQLPVRPPVAATIAWFLLLDRLHAPSWLWGVVSTCGALVWIFVVIALCVQKSVELQELK